MVMEIGWGPCVLVLKGDQQGRSLIGEAQYEGEAVWFTNSMGVLVSLLLSEKKSISFLRISKDTRTRGLHMNSGILPATPHSGPSQ